MTAYAIAGQHQQDPVPRRGGLFQQDWFQIVDDLPMGFNYVRAWDLAATIESQSSPNPDYTVGLKGCRLPDGTYLITDMVRFRKSAGQRDTLIQALADQDGYSCTQRFPQDPAQAGKSQVAHLERLLRGRTATFKPATGPKALRALPAATHAELGRIKLLKGPWNETFVNEVCRFPNGAHDDIVDSLSDLIDELARRSLYTLDNL